MGIYLKKKTNIMCQHILKSANQESPEFYNFFENIRGNHYHPMNMQKL